MKRISKYLFMFIGAIITLMCGLQNVFAADLQYDFSGYYFEQIGPNYASWKLQNYYVDGNVAFCIEPGIPEGNPIREATWEETGLSNNVKQRVLLLAYYGYQYNGHQTQAYRAATQALIWETILDNTRVTYSTERYGGGTPYNVDAEKNVINSLVAQHYTKPSFNGTTVTAQVGTSVTLTDTNNVLSNYEVYASNNANISINENQLTITPTEIGDVTLQFVKKQIYSRSYLIYVGDGVQNMISGGNVDPVYFSVNLKALGGKVEINKVDSDTMTTTPQGEASLSGAKFNIIDKYGNVIQTLTTDENGYAISDYLPYFGGYTLKEVSPSTGYLLSDEIVPFDSTKDSMLTYVKFKEDVITRDFEYTKIYSSDKTGIMIPEVGIKFGIYDRNNNLFKEEITDSEGKIYVTLPYGAYTLKQLTSTKDFEKMEDYKFEVREVGDTINKVFGNAEITARLKVVKVDSETGQTIERSNIKFRIFDVKNNEYVSQTITYPTAKTIDVFETDDNGILITPYPLKSGTYYLEEVDQVIDGYLWNDKSVEFEIGEDANLITDNEFGILFEVKFENAPVKGRIEINKTGEEVELTDKGFVYTKINLEGVKIGLYASDSIYDALGNLKYNKDTLVKELITDENGYVSLDNLYLGKYYLQEISTTNNHVLDKTKYSFELKYKDQYTAVITYTTTLENHLPKGTLEFIKTDFSTSETLPNTLIEIYTENDELVYSGRTDENGKIVITDLPVGKYYILEKEAPEGYKLNEEKMYFEITEDGQIVKCTMKDEIIEVPNTGKSNINYEIIGSIVLLISGLGLMIYGIKKRK